MPNQPDFILSSFFPVNRTQTNYRSECYLGKLCNQLGYEKEEEISRTLESVFKLCRTLDISVNENFERVFFEKGSTLYSDWKLSKLGMYLFVLNTQKNKRRDKPTSQVPLEELHEENRTY